MATEDRIRALLRLGAEDSEEGRTAAHQAARLIHKNKLLDNPYFLSTEAPAPLPVRAESAPVRIEAPVPVRPSYVPPNPYSRAYQDHVEKITAERREAERAEEERKKAQERKVYSFASKLERASRRSLRSDRVVGFRLHMLDRKSR